MQKKTQLLLDAKIAKDFHEQAKKLSEYPLDCGSMSALKKELIGYVGLRSWRH